MVSDTVPRVEVVERDLAAHVAHNNDRFVSIEQRLERIEGHILTLLQFRWQLVGALGVIVFMATLVAGWLK